MYTYIRIYLVEADPRLGTANASRANRLAVAAAIRLAAQGDVARQVGGIATRAVVAIRARCDQLNLAIDCGLGANGGRDIGVRAVDVLAHVAQNGGTRRGETARGDRRDPGECNAVRVRNGRLRGGNVDVQLVGRNLCSGGENGGHLLYQGKRKKFS